MLRERVHKQEKTVQIPSGTGGSTTNLKNTVDEHYRQFSDAIQDIVKGLDGYMVGVQTYDGYVLFGTGTNALAGDNDLYWDRALNKLVLGNALTVNGTFLSPSTGSNSFKAGAGSTSAGASSVSIGYNCTITAGNGGVCIGKNASTNASYEPIAIGEEAAANGNDSIAMSYQATATGSASIAIGLGAEGTEVAAISIGKNSSAGPHSIALGESSDSSASSSSIAIGPSATTTDDHCISIGYAIDVDSGFSIGIGEQVSIPSTSGSCVALGPYTAVAGSSDYGIAIGSGANVGASAESAIAIGRTANTSHTSSVALGYYATTTAANQFMIGSATAPLDIATTHTGIDWDLIDNNSSALSFDSADKAGILEIDTTDGSEGVKMSGYLSTTGPATIYYDSGIPLTVERDSGATTSSAYHAAVIRRTLDSEPDAGAGVGLLFSMNGGTNRNYSSIVSSRDDATDSGKVEISTLSSGSQLDVAMTIDSDQDIQISGGLSVDGYAQFNDHVFINQLEIPNSITTDHILVGAGTNNDPAIGFSSDDDGSGTGFYRYAADQLGVTANGTLTTVFYSGYTYFFKPVNMNDNNLYDLSGPLTLGYDGSSNHSLAAGPDTLVTGKLEVDDIAYFDGSYIVFGPEIHVPVSTGASTEAWRSGYTGSSGYYFYINEASSRTRGNFIFGGFENRSNSASFTAPSSIDPRPRLWVTSETLWNSDDTQWLSMEHDQTNARLTTGSGGIVLDPFDNMVLIDGYIQTGDVKIEGVGGTLTISDVNDGYAIVEIMGEIHSALPSTKAPTGQDTTIDFREGNSQVLNLLNSTGDFTINITGGQPGGSYSIKIIQHPSSPRNVSIPGVYWEGGSAYTATASNSAIDVVTFQYYGEYIGSYMNDLQLV